MARGKRVVPTGPREPVASVSHVAREGARELVTVGPDSPLWETVKSMRGIVTTTWKIPPGSIVRLRPPPSANEQDVGRLRAWVENLGGHAFVVPASKDSPLPGEAVAAPSRGPGAVTARGAVLDLVAASNVEDKKLLGEMAEAIMAKNGI